jgi:hypothetical protein
MAPADHLQISFHTDAQGARHLALRATGPRSQELVQVLRSRPVERPPAT